MGAYETKTALRQRAAHIARLRRAQAAVQAITVPCSYCGVNQGVVDFFLGDADVVACRACHAEMED